MRDYKYYVGDFETSVYAGQSQTEVWASALVELNTENVIILSSIEDTYTYLASLPDDIIIYYHNLKFDGHFWLDYILRFTNLTLSHTGEISDNTFEMSTKYKMENNTYTYSISGMGQWYIITIKVNDKYIEIRDSLKLLPFSVKEIGKAFQTKHQKLTMEYIGERHAHGKITSEEKEYIANDVLVVKEALEIMFQEGHKKLTIGACCLSEYKEQVRHPERGDVCGAYDWNELFPNLSSVEIDKSVFGSATVDEYIRKSYHGGWCYLVPSKAHKEFHNGITLDVNSLYPSMMSSESGSKYPLGYPVCHTGDRIKLTAQGFPVVKPDSYYFIRFSCSFEIRRNYLPTVQIKNNKNYKSTEWLETSRIKGKDGKYYKKVQDRNGNVSTHLVTMTMTETDYILFREHYKVTDLHVLDYMVFPCMIGIFDRYIDKYRKIKMESKGAKRTLAKLYLNNLYGKMATSTRNDSKIAYLNDDGIIQFHTVVRNDKTPVYIPVGSAITSYARNFTIRAAQANYYGKNKAGFIYADTDSIHCDISKDQLKAVSIDDVAFCKWKCEAEWDRAVFARQKTYIEHIEGKHEIKCAGMPEVCKQQVVQWLDEGKIDYSDFTTGLTVNGKLLPKRIKGGIVLQETTFKMS